MPSRACAAKVSVPLASTSSPRQIEVALLTGGGDKHYACGMGAALSGRGILVDFIGSNDLDVPELRRITLLNFLNLRGDHRTDLNFLRKASRVLIYYSRLVRYAATARPKIFHILWNNKFESFDRTLLLLYYKILGKRIVFTAHNVNAGKRDSKDTYLNRLTLRVQYRLTDHILVHTVKMQQELSREFDVPAKKITVIPYGINNAVPNTALTTREAKPKFGLSLRQKTLLFFGNIAPYKGLEHLVTAFGILARQDADYRLIVAGRPKGSDEYWKMIRQTIAREGLEEQIIQRIEYIPDDQVEAYFKAADVIVLPYTHIFQSGVLFLAYSFGLPVIASDVGSMKEDIIEGRTGFICRPCDPANIARVVAEYFESDLFDHLDKRRSDIQEFASDRYSWEKVGEITRQVYGELLRGLGGK
jgi:D-inositol-3-phosphate glycosyltransferase